ncbi:MAG: argininosuccinate lyase [Nitrospirales bacterium]|nr:argininosuccinate lyase [Nitrospirales bacterium]
MKRQPVVSSKKAWGGRFRERTHELVEQFTSSLAFDQTLFEQDIQGSMAHCQTLARAGVLTKAECAKIVKGLEHVRTEIRSGHDVFALEDEDIHMAIERRLTQLIGPLGGKLHTGRSRNDQVALDLRLYLRETLTTLLHNIQRVQQAFLTQARAHLDVIMPGYTHLQRAQPVLFSHHLLAYVEMFERDKGRIRDALTRLNVLPLGSGALAGSNYPLDRVFTAKLLDFPNVSQNSLDAVSDRDFVAEVLAALSILMMHLSRFSEELVLWSSQEYGFVELSDGFCTGSSMMPQKKNPDIPELVRGKTGRVYGHLVGLLTTLKGLPLSYNRDLQEDKEPLFDSLKTVMDSLEIYAEMVRHLHVHGEIMAEAAGSGYLLATELADYLVNKGVPFREAHEIVGNLVHMCIENHRELRDLVLADLQEASSHFGPDALSFLSLKMAISRKAQIGGTARKSVETRLKVLEKLVTSMSREKKRHKKAVS